ncbi:hypothetical protein EJ05DRAFT_10182 [Pseudovirgaria hyperparasitica]|uniref:Uncharacterized protein n=1 Tax=Pseudovirgaria hyperparasitica TaxID=470096 RepID=A0A6A6WL32_9PEZI|nr:uncharacterized protein EJ05DRAFT_10182 [Pseudovirgaria hyperparasitica]KAF2762709.1 hypothetical protein EJ05DRAFT_10182 [Pseudovirgaria hyperparasitica]
MKAYTTFAIVSSAVAAAAAPLNAAKRWAPSVRISLGDSATAIQREVSLDGTPFIVPGSGDERAVTVISIVDDNGNADSTCSAFDDEGNFIRGTNSRDLFFAGSNLDLDRRTQVFAVVCADAQSFPRSPGRNPNATGNNDNTGGQDNANPSTPTPSPPVPDQRGEEDFKWISVGLEDDEDTFVVRMAVLNEVTDISSFLPNGKILFRAEVFNSNAHSGAVCDTFADKAGTQNLNKPFGVNNSGLATGATSIGVNVQSIICRVP